MSRTTAGRKQRDHKRVWIRSDTWPQEACAAWSLRGRVVAQLHARFQLTFPMFRPKVLVFH